MLVTSCCIFLNYESVCALDTSGSILRKLKRPKSRTESPHLLVSKQADDQAFLYGEGDFKKTMGIAIASGFDCDNQAATLAGLLGVMHGGSAIPKDLTHEIAGNDWAEPFNNKYVNQRRPPLDPEYTNSEIIDKAGMPQFVSSLFQWQRFFLCRFACSDHDPHWPRHLGAWGRRPWRCLRVCGSEGPEVERARSRTS